MRNPECLDSIERNLGAAAERHGEVQAVLELRKRTGCPLLKCRDALRRAHGDPDKAVEILRQESGINNFRW